MALADEVVLPRSASQNRKRTSLLYAAAGIPHFLWLVENEDGEPVVYAYELDKTNGAYAIAGIHRGRLKVGAPVEVDLDLNDIDLL